MTHQPCTVWGCALMTMPVSAQNQLQLDNAQSPATFLSPLQSSKLVSQQHGIIKLAKRSCLLLASQLVSHLCTIPAATLRTCAQAVWEQAQCQQSGRHHKAGCLHCGEMYIILTEHSSGS